MRDFETGFNSFRQDQNSMGCHGPRQFLRCNTGGFRPRANNPTLTSHKEDGEDLHDFVLFIGHTGLQPDEAKRLQFRDFKIVEFSILNAEKTSGSHLPAILIGLE
jgi:hypothetical protein